MPKVSVIIPVFNREKIVANTIKQLLQQSIGDIEVICIDDGSTDNSLNVIIEIATVDSRVCVFHQDNAGPGVARNNGILHSNGEYIAFLDSDDEFCDVDIIKKLYHIAKKKDVNICGGNILFKSDNGEIKRDSCYVFDEGLLDFKNYQYDSMFTRFIYKKSFLEENNICFPNLRNYEDTVFLLQAMIKAKQFYYINKDVYIYNRQHVDNVKLKEKDVIDGLKGICINLRLSNKHDLKDLHVRIYRYLMSFIYLHVNRLLPSDDIQLFYELIQCNMLLNFDWIKSAGIEISDPIILPPLQTIWNAGNRYLKLRKIKPDFLKKHILKRIKKV